MVRSSAKRHAKELARTKQKQTANRLRIMGLTETEIALRIGVSQPTIHSWLNEAREVEHLRWSIGRHELQERQAEQMALVQVEAWRGWRKSLRDAIEETTSADDRAGESTSTKRKGQCGSPAHLAQVIRASERLARLLGLDEQPLPRELSTLEQQTGEMEIVEVVVDSTPEATRLRDQHLVAVRSQEIQPIKEPVDDPPSDPKPRARKRKPAVEATPEADQEAAGVRPPPDPHQRVRGRPRGRKD